MPEIVDRGSAVAVTCTHTPHITHHTHTTCTTHHMCTPHMRGMHRPRAQRHAHTQHPEHAPHHLHRGTSPPPPSPPVLPLSVIFFSIPGLYASLTHPNPVSSNFCLKDQCFHIPALFELVPTFHAATDLSPLDKSPLLWVLPSQISGSISRFQEKLIGSN